MYTQELQEIISPLFTDEFLFNIVKKKTGWTDICIKKIDIDRSASKKGDSYLSTVSRFIIEATGTGKCDVNKKLALKQSITISVITKTIPKNVARRKTFRSSDFFPNEINFYEIVWETYKKFIKSKNLNYQLEDILPVYLGSASDNGNNDFIALEDACSKGFEGVSRGEGLNIEYTMLIIKCFAQFHAISYAYKNQHPDDFKNITSALKETYFHDGLRPWYCGFQKNLINIIRDCVEKQLPDFYLRAFDELTLKSDFYRILCDLCAQQTPLSVVCHGDAWVPNFLIKYNELREPQEPLMIDFQLTRCCSLGLDVSFFLFCSTAQSTRVKYYEDIIREYYNTFQVVCKELGTDASKITYEEVSAEIKQAGKFAVGMTMENIVMSLLDDDEVADIDGIQGDEALPLEDVWVLRPFTSEDKRQRIADMIKFAVDYKFI